MYMNEGKLHNIKRATFDPKHQMLSHVDVWHLKAFISDAFSILVIKKKVLH